MGKLNNKNGREVFQWLQRSAAVPKLKLITCMPTPILIPKYKAFETRQALRGVLKGGGSPIWKGKESNYCRSLLHALRLWCSLLFMFLLIVSFIVCFVCFLFWRTPRTLRGVANNHAYCDEKRRDWELKPKGGDGSPRVFSKHYSCGPPSPLLSQLPSQKTPHTKLWLEN